MILWIGLLGVTLILFAYVMVINKKWEPSAPTNLIVNIIGCTLTSWYDLTTGPTVFLILQVFWGIVSLIKLLHVYQYRTLNYIDKTTGKHPKDFDYQL